MEIHHRKNIRLNGYDYNTPGWYFITICTKNKQKLLGAVVGTGLPDGPYELKNQQVYRYFQTVLQQILWLQFMATTFLRPHHPQ